MFEPAVVRKWLQETFLTILFLRSALTSLDFPIVVCVGQFNECSKTNLFYVDAEKLPAVVNHDYWRDVKRPCLVYFKWIQQPTDWHCNWSNTVSIGKKEKKKDLNKCVNHSH